MATNRWLISCHLTFSSDGTTHTSIFASFELETATDKEALTWTEVDNAVRQFGLSRTQDPSFTGALSVALVSASAIAVSPLARAEKKAAGQTGVPGVPEQVHSDDTAAAFATDQGK